ncbi:hypothetical protein BAT02nite_28730 [Bacillus atrophaeus]|nr:hypothetical protein BAT02nite_28730 [Bacillus atrophaeus]
MRIYNVKEIPILKAGFLSIINEKFGFFRLEKSYLHYRCRGPVSVRSLLKTPHKPPDLGR